MSHLIFRVVCFVFADWKMQHWWNAVADVKMVVSNRFCVSRSHRPRFRHGTHDRPCLDSLEFFFETSKKIHTDKTDKFIIKYQPKSLAESVSYPEYEIW